MPPPNTHNSPPVESKFARPSTYLLFVSILFLSSPSLVPGVNESHYLPKAKRAWDASYAAGGDVFLDSHDSHFLATALAGGLAHLLPLEGVAWTGRVISWLLLAWAWGHWCRAVRIKPLVQPLLLIAWVLATHYGHWAGEWFVGGFEAKSIAYPLVILGLAALVEGRWPQVWLWLGAATAWHPLVGGWAGLTVAGVWLWGLYRDSWSWRKQRLAQSLPAQLLAFAIGLIGVLPAALGIGRSGGDFGNVSPAAVHVYFRLSHHMAPQLFADERHVWGAASLIVLAGVTAWWLYVRGRLSCVTEWSAPISRLGVVLAVAWLSVAVSAIGLAIDLGLSARRPGIAASLLRFYWFRWSDIALPLAWTTTAAVLLQSLSYRSQTERGLTPIGNWLLGLGLLGVGSLFGMHVNENLQRGVPPADEILMSAVGPNSIETDRYLDWLAVCEWIEENTPPDSLWLTPKYQQSFKWYAGRAEVVCWKDVPQDNRSVVEWYQRVERCQPPRQSNRRGSSIRGWTTEELLQLSSEYGFRWVLLDRTYQTEPPALEFLYPINIENRSFAVVRIPEGLVEPR